MKRSTPQDRNVGAKIREFRVARSWTQSELAAQMQLHGCDLSREIIARIESGYRRSLNWLHKCSCTVVISHGK